MAQTSLYSHLTAIAAKQEEVDHTSLMHLVYQHTTAKDAVIGRQQGGCVSSSLSMDPQQRLNPAFAGDQIEVGAIFDEQMPEREQDPTLSCSSYITSTRHHHRHHHHQQTQQQNIYNADSVDQDRALAECLQREWQNQDRHEEQARDLMLRDQYLAESLQRQWHAELARGKELREMARANYGRASKFVQELCKLNETWTQRANDPTISLSIEVVAARNGLVHRVQQVMDQQDAFRTAGNKPTWVDIGYHYTTRSNMPGIAQAGLLTKAERRARNIRTNDNGSLMGDGIYTSNNPYVYHGKFGDVGLMVLRLKGRTHHLDERGIAAAAAVAVDENPEVDTLISGTKTSNERVVLRQSTQCAALVSFHWSLIRPEQRILFGNQFVESYCRELQGLVNEFFNL